MRYVHCEMTIAVIDGKCAEAGLILIHSYIGDEAVVSDINGLGEASLQYYPMSKSEKKFSVDEMNPQILKSAR